MAYGSILGQITDLSNYVTNNQLNAKLNTYLPLNGGTMTGNINMNNKYLNNVPTPTSSLQAANKQYVDNQLSNMPRPSSNNVILPTGITLIGSVSFSTSVDDYNYGDINIPLSSQSQRYPIFYYIITVSNLVSGTAPSKSFRIGGSTNNWMVTASGNYSPTIYFCGALFVEKQSFNYVTQTYNINLSYNCKYDVNNSILTIPADITYYGSNVTVKIYA